MTLIESGGTILVSCQQTRFYIVEDNASKEIDVKDINLTLTGRVEEAPSASKVKSKSKAKVQGVEILSHADLRLKAGVHYALVGRNGSGKSTLLRALGDRLIPGIPTTTRIAILQQTSEDDASDEAKAFKASSETALAKVIGSDPHRNKLKHQLDILNQGIESTNSIAPIRALRKVKYENFLEEYFEARKDAHLRSGARGSEARKTLLTYEARDEEWKKRLDEADLEIDSTTIETETKEAVDMQAELQSQLDTVPLVELETKARRVLTGLGFKEQHISMPVSKMSGGWRMRCLLAEALVQTADVLMLDEPTNYLDLLGILWLQNYLDNLDAEKTLVLVSHDRDFLNAVCSETIILRDQKLTYHEGNLASYEKSVQREILRMTRMKEAHDRQKAHMEKTVANNIKQGKKTGDDGKLRQAKSRQRKLDERMGVQVSAKGTRFKLNRDMAGYFTSNRQAIEIPKEERGVDMSFPPAPDLRFPGSLLSLEKVGLTYARSKAAGPTLVDVDLVVHPGDRVGILGLNGAGKSTLVRVLVDELKPSRGAVTRHPRVKVGYYSQHAVEALKLAARNDPAATALSVLVQRAAEADGGGEVLAEQPARALLGGLGLQGRTAAEVPLAKLSGGQLVRLALAILFLDPPHVFVLDEPTTHLDLPTVTAMAHALKEYDGAVVLVTHDRFFMRCVIEGEPVNPEDSEEEGSEDEIEGASGDAGKRRLIYNVKAGKVSLRDGGVTSWETGLENKLRKMEL